MPLQALMWEETLLDGEQEVYRKKVMGMLEKVSLRILRGAPCVEGPGLARSDLTDRAWKW